MEALHCQPTKLLLIMRYPLAFNTRTTAIKLFRHRSKLLVAVAALTMGAVLIRGGFEVPPLEKQSRRWPQVRTAGLVDFDWISPTEVVTIGDIGGQCCIRKYNDRRSGSIEMFRFDQVQSSQLLDSLFASWTISPDRRQLLCAVGSASKSFYVNCDLATGKVDYWPTRALCVSLVCWLEDSQRWLAIEMRSAHEMFPSPKHSRITLGDRLGNVHIRYLPLEVALGRYLVNVTHIYACDVASDPKSGELRISMMKGCPTRFGPDEVSTVFYEHKSNQGVGQTNIQKGPLAPHGYTTSYWVWSPSTRRVLMFCEPSIHNPSNGLFDKLISLVRPRPPNRKYLWVSNADGTDCKPVAWLQAETEYPGPLHWAPDERAVGFTWRGSFWVSKLD
jgi:hypothetical protein